MNEIDWERRVTLASGGLQAAAQVLMALASCVSALVGLVHWYRSIKNKEGENDEQGS